MPPLLTRPLAASLCALALGLAVAACGAGGGSSSAAATATGTTTGTSPAPRPARAGRESEVSFEADGTKTYGTFELPVHHQGPVAVALLIPGSGPTDRDGNDDRLGLHADTLGLLAELLAERGIASLRYDKYFAGKTGAGRFAADPAKFTVGAELDQALGAYEYMRGLPGVDPSRLLLVGHSEGGMVAMSVADRAAVAPAGLALLEPQDLRHLDLVRIQTEEHIGALMQAGELEPLVAGRDVRAVVAAIDRFRAGREVSEAELPPLVAELLAPELLTPDNAAFDRSHDRIVPAALARRLPRGTRVLVTEGTRDANVPLRTIGLLTAGLRKAGTTGPGLVVLHGTDHLLHLASQPDSEAVLAPAARAAVAAWAAPFASP
jgi:uncharacterized protein